MSEKLTTNEMATMLEKIATDPNGAVASSLMKTLLSKNITIDDWNTFAKILADHSINDTVLQEFSKAVVEYLEALDSKDKSLTDNIGTLQTDVGVLKTDMSGAKEDITILKDRMEMAKNDIEIAQEPGDSETAVMSQKAVTEAISNAITNTLNTEV